MPRFARVPSPTPGVESWLNVDQITKFNIQGDFVGYALVGDSEGTSHVCRMTIDDFVMALKNAEEV